MYFFTTNLRSPEKTKYPISENKNHTNTTIDKIQPKKNKKTKQTNNNIRLYLQIHKKNVYPHVTPENPPFVETQNQKPLYEN